MHSHHLRRIERATLLLAMTMVAACTPTRHAPVADVRPPVARASERAPARMAERHFTDGSLLSMRERHAEAIAEYRRALQFDSSSGAIYYAIGRSYRELNEIDSAIRYSRLAAKHGSIAAVHEQLADLLMLSGDIDGAIDQYDSMLARDANHLQSRYMMARLLQSRDPERAIEHYEFILNNLVDDIDVMLRLAELYLDRDNVDGALDMMQRMITLESTSADLHQMTTSILLDARRYGEAIALLRAVETRVPPGTGLEGFYLEVIREVDDRLSSQSDRNDSLAMYATELVVRASALARTSTVRAHAGSIALRVGDAARAEALFTRALDDTLASAQTWMHVVGAYRDAGDAETALRIALPRIARHLDDYRVSYLTGALFVAVANNDSAVAWLRRSIDVYEENAEAWAALAEVYRSMDRPGLSDAAFERAIAIESGNPVVLNNFAYALAQRGARLDRALELIEAALAVEPDNEFYLDTRAWVHFRRGELDAAVTDLERAIAIGGAAADVYEHLGDVRAARGETTAAREAYEQARRLDPERPGLRAKIDGMR